MFLVKFKNSRKIRLRGVISTQRISEAFKMSKRHKIFCENYNNIVGTQAHMIELPGRGAGARNFLYDSFQHIDEGKFNLVKLQLHSVRVCMPKDTYELTEKILNSYIKAYHSTVPHNLDDNLEEVAKDRAELKELAKMFKYPL